VVKRHPALRDLSSDHHQGLVHARHLKQGAETLGGGEGAKSINTEQIVTEFLAFWVEHTVHHFREEEEIMLPAFSRYGDPSAEPVIRMLMEHVQIRRLVDDLGREASGDGPSVDTMQALAELFRAHIRYEEDVVFPLIESAMPEAALLDMAAQLSVASQEG
jgi:hemerythrin-like domain-containing protein